MSVTDQPARTIEIMRELDSRLWSGVLLALARLLVDEAGIDPDRLLVWLRDELEEN